MIKLALIAVSFVVALPGSAAAEPNLVGPACWLPRQEAAVDLSLIRDGYSVDVEAPKQQVIDVTLSSHQLNTIRVGARDGSR